MKEFIYDLMDLGRFALALVLASAPIALAFYIVSLLYKASHLPFPTL